MNFLQKIVKECSDHSPELLLGVGIAGTIVTVVTACKATLKVNEVLEEHKENLDKIEETVADTEIEEYTAEDAKRDKVIQYRDTAFKLVKLYAPAIILGTLSIGCMIKSNDILNKRNLSLAAAYTLMSDAYSTYRQRVINRFGEEVDYQLQNDVHEVEVTETDEDGNWKETEKADVVSKPLGYARYFTRSNPDWDDDENFIEMFFKAQVSAINNRLGSKYSAKPWIVLNEMYSMFNFKESIDAMEVGYVYGDKVDIRFNKVKIVNEFGSPESAYLVEFFGISNIRNRVA